MLPGGRELHKISQPKCLKTVTLQRFTVSSGDPPASLSADNKNPLNRQVKRENHSQSGVHGHSFRVRSMTNPLIDEGLEKYSVIRVTFSMCGLGLSSLTTLEPAIPPGGRADLPFHGTEPR